MASQGQDGTPPPSVADETAEVGLACYPRGEKPALGYGTAGFRAASEGLDHIMYRMGVLAALRSKALGGVAVGVMVTASHNAEPDNGVKLVDPSGEMLAQEWEAFATDLANVSDDCLASKITNIASAAGVDLSRPAAVIVGRDTRGSSPRLAIAVADGAGSLRPTAPGQSICCVRSLGLVTTPQLHYIVRCENAQRCSTALGPYGVPSLRGYADKLLTAYNQLVQSAGDSSQPKKYIPQLTIDCANGVGAVALRPMLLRGLGLNIELRNVGDGVLNSGCGADFVKVKQVAPAGVELAPGRRMASFDGDADRIVYFFDDGSGFRLLDGDRIALLLAHFIAPRLREAGLSDVRMGLVQTAYANGGSTARAVEVLGEKSVVCAKTGVKHCHHAAAELDVGIYYEANGHGTALFSERFVKAAKAAVNGNDPAAAAARQLLLLRDIINETVGDAISNVLAVEAVLRLLDWDCRDWIDQYSDLPNRQVKVTVTDRSAIETTNAERTCTKPEGLQAEIDRLVGAAGSRARAFVRPSGTEDIVRVYAEAETTEAMISLGQAVADAVYARAGGVGVRPHVA